ncbi:unnamed protein product [Brassica oleracea]
MRYGLKYNCRQAPNTEKRSPKHGKTKQTRTRKQPYNYLQQNIDHSSRQSTSTRTISSEKQTDLGISLRKKSNPSNILTRRRRACILLYC